MGTNIARDMPRFPTPLTTVKHRGNKEIFQIMMGVLLRLHSRSGNIYRESFTALEVATCAM